MILLTRENIISPTKGRLQVNPSANETETRDQAEAKSRCNVSGREKNVRKSQRSKQRDNSVQRCLLRTCLREELKLHRIFSHRLCWKFISGFQATEQHKHLTRFYMYFYRERNPNQNIPTFLVKCQSNQPVKMSSFILINTAQGCGRCRHARVPCRRGDMNTHDAAQENGSSGLSHKLRSDCCDSHCSHWYQNHSCTRFANKNLFVWVSGFITTSSDWRA